MNITLKITPPRLLAGFGTAALIGAVCLVSSRPAHTAGGPIAVSIANTPLAVTLAGNAAGQQPFTASTVYVFTGADNFTDVDTADGYTSITVPAGKRLIIQTVSTSADGGIGSSHFQASIGISINGSVQLFALPIVSDFDVPFAGATQSMNLSSDGGTAIQFQGVRANPLATQYIRVAMYGYLVDAP